MFQLVILEKNVFNDIIIHIIIIYLSLKGKLQKPHVVLLQVMTCNEDKILISIRIHPVNFAKLVQNVLF